MKTKIIRKVNPAEEFLISPVSEEFCCRTFSTVPNLGTVSIRDPETKVALSEEDLEAGKEVELHSGSGVVGIFVIGSEGW